MHARFTSFLDRDAFIDLASLCAAETTPKLAFDENIALYTFNGAYRMDPAIIVLQEGKELVGFLIARGKPMLFCAAQVLVQEALFIRADKRSVEAETLLLQALQSFAAVMKPAETHFAVSIGSEHLTASLELVEGMGCRWMTAQMCLPSSAAQSAVTCPSACRVSGAVLH